METMGIIGFIRALLGLSRDNRKYNGNYYIIIGCRASRWPWSSWRPNLPVTGRNVILMARILAISRLTVITRTIAMIIFKVSVTVLESNRTMGPK